jgi:hypothetical protein
MAFRQIAPWISKVVYVDWRRSIQNALSEIHSISGNVHDWSNKRNDNKALESRSLAASHACSLALPRCNLLRQLDGPPGQNKEPVKRNMGFRRLR